jgi:hypothetical protein
MDDIAELADRMREKMRRGEEWEFEFETDFASFTGKEQDDFIAFEQQQIAHKKEELEALEEDSRILKILLRLDVGLITPLQAVQQIRGAVPDPLAE